MGDCSVSLPYKSQIYAKMSFISYAYDPFAAAKMVTNQIVTGSRSTPNVADETRRRDSWSHPDDGPMMPRLGEGDVHAGSEYLEIPRHCRCLSEYTLG